MASFSESVLVKKLTEINPSQQSIQTLSLWLIHHRKHHPVVVKIWYNELLKAPEKHKIVFLYLANDVIQNSRKKGPEYGKAFAKVLLKAFAHFSKLPNFNAKYRKNLDRVLDIWMERGVYELKLVAEFKKALGHAKKPKSDKKKSTRHSKAAKKKKPEPKIEIRIEDELNSASIQLDSPHTPFGDPPELNEFINAILALENSASSDAEVREEIVALPPDVSDVRVLVKIQNRAAAEELSKQVNAAYELTSSYNHRLSLELEDRKKVKAMLQNFTMAQNELLLRAKQRLKEYHEKLQKVHQMRQAMRSHLQNLPDLTQMPDATEGLAPLPSAGDLFRLNSQV